MHEHQHQPPNHHVIKEAVRRSGLFDGLTGPVEPLVHALGATTRKVLTGQTIDEGGDPESQPELDAPPIGLVLVVSGRMEETLVRDGQHFVWRLLFPGDVAGLDTLDNEPSAADLRAAVNSEVIIIPAAQLMTQITQHPQLAINLFSHHARQTRECKRVMALLVARDFMNLLLDLLCQMARGNGKTLDGAVLIWSGATINDLAEMLNISRRSATSYFRRLVRSGLVGREKGRVWVAQSALDGHTPATA